MIPKLYKGTSQRVSKPSFDNYVGVSYFVNSTFEVFIYENCSTDIDRHINRVNSIYGLFQVVSERNSTNPAT